MDFKEIAVLCLLFGAWPSLEIWIDGVFRVFTFVTPTLKILAKKGKKAGLKISHFCPTSCTVAHPLFSKNKLCNCSVMCSYVFVLTATQQSLCHPSEELLDKILTFFVLFFNGPPFSLFIFQSMTLLGGMKFSLYQKWSGEVKKATRGWFQMCKSLSVETPAKLAPIKEDEQTSFYFLASR